MMMAWTLQWTYWVLREWRKGNCWGNFLPAAADWRGFWINLTFLSLICCFRFDGFEQGLNNFHINAKSILGQQNSENCRKSPPNKKTKKTNLDFSLDNPNTAKETKFGDSDKFLFLGKYYKKTPCSRNPRNSLLFFALTSRQALTVDCEKNIFIVLKY